MIQAIVERCAGIDIGKKSVAVCLMVGAADQEPTVEFRSYSTFTAELERMKEWLLQAGCRQVLMESTGAYWKPILNILEGSLEVYLANAEDVRGRKGHKTDKEDSWWLAHLWRHGMVRTSFIPSRPVRELRDLTRRRKQLLKMATSEKNRIQKVLEDANVKLSSVLSDVFGVSGQLMLEALLEGKLESQQIAEFAQRRARQKIPEIAASLEGHRFNEHHRWLIGQNLELLRALEQQLIELDEQILRRIEQAGYLKQMQLLETIPGIQRDSAVVILAETGPELKQFPTAGQLSSWAGVCPGNKRSAGKNLGGHITRGNRWLRAALTESAWAVAHTKRGPLREKYWRLQAGGKKRALIAVAHALLVVIHRVLTSGQPYQPSEAQPMEESKRLRMIRHHVRCLGRLGISAGPMLAASRPYRTKTRVRKAEDKSTLKS